MPNFYFIGGEDSDFKKIMAVSVNATAAYRRAAYSRTGLHVGGVSSGSVNQGWIGAFTTTLTSFWLSAQLYLGGLTSQSELYDLLAFYDGDVRRLILVSDGSSHFRLVTQNAAGTRTTLVTSTNTFSSATLYKIDIQVVSYGASATVNLYVDGVLWATYTGDIRTDGSSSLSSFCLGMYSSHSTAFSVWTEVIVSDSDTRGMSLSTLYPAANGNTFDFTSGSYTAIDEATLDDSDIATIAQTTVNSSLLAGTPGIHAVCVSARAQKGDSGPANAQLMVRTGSTDYVSSNVAQIASWERSSNIWTTNPNTASPWVYSELAAAGFNIGIKSIT
jgi:hypothetical protein